MSNTFLLRLYYQTKTEEQADQVLKGLKTFAAEQTKGIGHPGVISYHFVKVAPTLLRFTELYDECDGVFIRHASTKEIMEVYPKTFIKQNEIKNVTHTFGNVTDQAFQALAFISDTSKAKFSVGYHFNEQNFDQNKDFKEPISFTLRVKRKDSSEKAEKEMIEKVEKFINLKSNHSISCLFYYAVAKPEDIDKTKYEFYITYKNNKDVTEHWEGEGAKLIEELKNDLEFEEAEVYGKINEKNQSIIEGLKINHKFKIVDTGYLINPKAKVNFNYPVQGKVEWSTKQSFVLKILFECKSEAKKKEFLKLFAEYTQHQQTYPHPGVHYFYCEEQKIPKNSVLITEGFYDELSYFASFTRDRNITKLYMQMFDTSIGQISSCWTLGNLTDGIKKILKAIHPIDLNEKELPFKQFEIKQIPSKQIKKENSCLLSIELFSKGVDNGFIDRTANNPKVIALLKNMNKDDIFAFNCLQVYKAYPNRFSVSLIYESIEALISQLESFDKDGELKTITQRNRYKFYCSQPITEDKKVKIWSLLQEKFKFSGKKFEISTLHGFCLNPSREVEHKYLKGEKKKKKEPLAQFIQGYKMFTEMMIKKHYPKLNKRLATEFDKQFDFWINAVRKSGIDKEALNSHHILPPAYIIALYVTLQTFAKENKWEEKELLKKTEDLMMATFRGMMSTIFDGLLKQIVMAKDRWKFFENYIKIGNKQAYAPPLFNLTPVEVNKIDGKRELSFKIKRCVYFDIFKRLNYTKLGHILCEFDSIMAKCVSKYFKFERPTTIAKGCDHCLFKYKELDW